MPSPYSPSPYGTGDGAASDGAEPRPEWGLSGDSTPLGSGYSPAPGSAAPPWQQPGAGTTDFGHPSQWNGTRYPSPATTYHFTGTAATRPGAVVGACLMVWVGSGVSIIPMIFFGFVLAAIDGVEGGPDVSTVPIMAIATVGLIIALVLSILAFKRHKAAMYLLLVVGLLHILGYGLLVAGALISAAPAAIPFVIAIAWIVGASALLLKHRAWFDGPVDGAHSPWQPNSAYAGGPVGATGVPPAVIPPAAIAPGGYGNQTSYPVQPGSGARPGYSAQPGYPGAPGTGPQSGPNSGTFGNGPQSGYGWGEVRDYDG